MGQLASLVQIFSLFVFAQENAELFVVFLLCLFDRQHALEALVEALQVLHQQLLIVNEFHGLLLENLEVPLLIRLNKKNFTPI